MPVRWVRGVEKERPARARVGDAVVESASREKGAARGIEGVRWVGTE